MRRSSLLNDRTASCYPIVILLCLSHVVVQAERQQAAASVTAPDEASMRRSIQAECDKKLKEEKLGLIKRTLAVGKKAVWPNMSCLGLQFKLADQQCTALAASRRAIWLLGSQPAYGRHWHVLKSKPAVEQCRSFAMPFMLIQW